MGYSATPGKPGVAGSLNVTWPDARLSRHARATASMEPGFANMEPGFAKRNGKGHQGG